MAEDKEQTVEAIAVRDLILWTENPRDPISPRSKNESVIRRALEDTDHKWTLRKLAKAMGPRYDLSELPTVVYKSGHPIVYDGNRRVVLAKAMLSDDQKTFLTQNAVSKNNIVALWQDDDM